MFIDDLSVDDLRQILEPHMKRTAWPGLKDPKVVAAARRYARKYGLWSELHKALAAGGDIPVLRRSSYRAFKRSGDRNPQQEEMFSRVARTEQTALALWLEHPAANLDALQDLMWSWCDTWTWVMSAHEDQGPVDLSATMIGAILAEIVAMLGDRLEPEVAQRVTAEVRRRVLDAAADPRRPPFWQTIPHNWNHVCNGNLILTALHLLDNPHVLAAYIHPLIWRLGYALHGFADDGGCLEGPSYWDYGFGHFLDAAVALHHRSGGKLDLLADDKVQRICRYPLAAHLEGDQRTVFADATNGSFQAENLLKINYFLDLPALFAVGGRHGDGTPKVSSWRGVALLSDRHRPHLPPRGLQRDDALLPDLGQAVLRAGRGANRAILAALAGHNSVPHNHNDVGSFIYMRAGTPVLVDPGAPKYTAKTFSPQRYEILLCRSLAHSVPVINGHEQPFGSQYRGTIQVEGRNSAGPKAAIIEMAQAYPDKTLTRLQRRLELDDRGGLTIRDRYEFTKRPRKVQEAFVTWLDAAISRHAAVRIGRGDTAADLTALSRGRFTIQRLQDEDPSQRDGRILTRIVFEPRQLGRHMDLAFLLRANGRLAGPRVRRPGQRRVPRSG